MLSQGRVYTQHSTTARETATVEVIAPASGTGACCTLKLEVMVRRRMCCQAPGMRVQVC